MTRRPVMPDRLLVEAYAFDEAWDSYIAWHWDRFKAAPVSLERAVREAPPARPCKPRTGPCPRCAQPRTLGPTTRRDASVVCRRCQRDLLPLVPDAERRRGCATAEGYRLALAAEQTLSRADKARTAVQRHRAKRRAADPDGYRWDRAAAERERRARARTQRAGDRGAD